MVELPFRVIKHIAELYSERVSDFKASFDIAVSLLLLVPLSIVLLGLLQFKLEDGGPVFYRQERVTTNGRSLKYLRERWC